jgi:hypothetical protein
MTAYGPCASWPAQWGSCSALSTASPAATGQAVDAATEILHALSGRQFGACTVTLRPCRRDCADAPWGWAEWPSASYPQPALIGGLWFNLACGSCPGACSCSRLSEVLLPAPIRSITQVKVDGSPLATGAYRVDDARVLVRTDGSEWPRCNDLAKPDTQAGTWSVTATYGQDVPPSGSWPSANWPASFSGRSRARTAGCRPTWPPWSARASRSGCRTRMSC